MGIVDDVKAVAKTVQQIGNIELYQKILDLQSEIMEVVEENQSLKRRITELEEESRIRSELIVQDDCYWIPQDSGHPDGPYCTNCWDVRGDLVRMWKSANPEYSSCPNCKNAMLVRRYD